MDRLVAILSALNLSAAICFGADPYIFPSTNAVVVLPDKGMMACLVSNETGVAWTKVSGPGTVTFDNALKALTDASFSAAGSYVVKLTATNASSTNSVNINVTVLPARCQLRVTTGGTGTGTVGDGSTSYAFKNYDGVQTVTLTAAAGGGSTFIGWFGNWYSGTDNPLTVTVRSNQTLTAIFDTSGTGTSTYYVATNGNNSNDGSLAQPWSNIWYAAKTATAGSRVIVKAGVYAEYATNTVSGTAENPIVFQGERGANGEWLTIIDPSVPLSTGWVSAPEVGAGVWKNTTAPWPARWLTIDGKAVVNPYTNGYNSSFEDAWVGNTDVTTGLKLMALGAETNVPTSSLMAGYRQKWWDAIGAMFCTQTNGDGTATTWLRLRDGTEPNGMDIRVARYRDDRFYVYADSRPVILMSGASNIVWRNFELRNAPSHFYIDQLSQSNIVECNYLLGPRWGVHLNNGANGNRIQANDITGNNYGCNDVGAASTLYGTNEYSSVVRIGVYSIVKYVVDAQIKEPDAVLLYYGTSNNVITGNRIEHSWGNAINVWSPDATKPVRNSSIENNLVSGASACCINVQPNQINTRIYDNSFNNAEVNIRFQNMDQGDETNRTVYIYRNTSWNPDWRGQHIYFHYVGVAADYWPELWFYQNSFSGAGAGFRTAPTGLAAGGVPEVHFLNNIFSGNDYWYYSSIWFVTNAATLGEFDYNVVTAHNSFPQVAMPEWYGSHNVLTTDTWTSSPTMGFLLPAASPAINAGMDIPTVYATLPQDGTVKVGAAWDMGAFEYLGSGANSVAQIGTLSVGTLNVNQ